MYYLIKKREDVPLFDYLLSLHPNFYENLGEDLTRDSYGCIFKIESKNKGRSPNIENFNYSLSQINFFEI